MAVTVQSFKQAFEEFRSTDDATISAKLAEAKLQVTASMWGVKTDIGVRYLTAHLISLAPSGENAKLSVDAMGKTVYLAQFNRVLRQVTTGIRSAGFSGSAAAAASGITDADLAAGLEALRLQVETNTANIATNVTDIATNVTDIATNAAAIAALPSSLTNRVIVEQKSDLPTPVAGAINLLDDTVYQFNGSTTLGTDHLVMGTNTYLLGEFAARDSITYTGVGTAAIRASGGVNLKVTRLGIIVPLGSAFDAVDAPFALVIEALVIGNSIGTFTDCDVVSTLNVVGIDLESGFLFSGACDDLVVRGGTLSQKVGGVGTLIDLGTTVCNFIEIGFAIVKSAVGGTDLSGLAANGNLTASTGRGVILGGRLNGLGTHLVGVSVDDAQWNMRQVDGIRDSTAIGQASMTGNAVATDISTAGAGVMVKVAGTTTLDFARRFDDGASPTSNRIRYTSFEERTIVIICNMTVIKVGGTVHGGSVQIHKNGSPIGISFPFKVDNKGSAAEVSAIDDADTDDYYECFISNDDSATDITVPGFVIRSIPIGT